MVDTTKLILLKLRLPKRFNVKLTVRSINKNYNAGFDEKIQVNRGVPAGSNFATLDCN